jgi:hypothetical protein
VQDAQQIENVAQSYFVLFLFLETAFAPLPPRDAGHRQQTANRLGAGARLARLE